MTAALRCSGFRSSALLWLVKVREVPRPYAPQCPNSVFCWAQGESRHLNLGTSHQVERRLIPFPASFA